MGGSAAYERYLRHRGRTEAQVLPLVRHREVYDDPNLQALLKTIEDAAASGDPAAQSYWPALNPASELTTNDLLTSLNHQLQTRMSVVGWDLPDNVVVGVY